MKQLLTITCTMISVLATSCGSKQGNEEEKIFHFDTSNAEVIDLDQIKGTPLEADYEGKPYSIVGDVNDITLVGDKILIYTNDFSPNGTNLLVYNDKGQFLNPIGFRGRAGNEYSWVKNYWFEGENVCVLDFNARKIVKYTLDGRHIETVSITDKKSVFGSLIPFGEGFIGECTYVGSNGDYAPSPAIAYYDKDYNFVSNIGDHTIRSGIDMGNPISTYGKIAYYKHTLDRKIYTINSKLESTHAYTIDFGEMNMPDLATFKDEYEVASKLRDDNWAKRHVATSFNFSFTKYGFSFTYGIGKEFNIGSCNTKSGKTHCVKFKSGKHIIIAKSFGEDIVVLAEGDENAILYILRGAAKI
ncbi:MAG: 6-bladed beta-propeller [Alistipes sp.]|nr:6-bladed beta-propeller [Alistipes sp.]